MINCLFNNSYRDNCQSIKSVECNDFLYRYDFFVDDFKKIIIERKQKNETKSSRRAKLGRHPQQVFDMTIPYFNDEHISMISSKYEVAVTSMYRMIENKTINPKYIAYITLFKKRYNEYILKRYSMYILKFLCRDIVYHIMGFVI